MSTTLSVLQFLREAKSNLNKSAFKFLPVLQGRGGFLFFIREARTASCGELQLYNLFVMLPSSLPSMGMAIKSK